MSSTTSRRASLAYSLNWQSSSSELLLHRSSRPGATRGVLCVRLATSWAARSTASLPRMTFQTPRRSRCIADYPRQPGVPSPRQPAMHTMDIVATLQPSSRFDQGSHRAHPRAELGVGEDNQSARQGHIGWRRLRFPRVAAVLRRLRKECDRLSASSSSSWSRSPRV